jgi:AcrR family transcriptional regulator
MGIAERKEREKQMRRDLILKASEEVFFEKGLRAATLDDVAERAEVSKGTIYLYFSSKEDLYYSLMTKGLSMLLTAFEETEPDGSDPQKALLRFGEAYLKFSDEQSHIFRMLAAVDNPVMTEQISPKVLSDLEGMSDKVLSYVAKFLQKGIDSGLFRSDMSPYEAVILFWVSLSGILNLKERAAAVGDKGYTKKDSVLHGVEYVSFYNKCVKYLMEFLIIRGPKHFSKSTHAGENKVALRRTKGRTQK